MEIHRMRPVLAAVLAALAGLGPAASAADPSADVARSYVVKASADPAVLKSGATGTVRLAVEPTGAVHVDPKAPLKVTLVATPGLSLQKTQLGRAEAAPAGQGVAFTVPFTAGATGKQEVKARLDFFLCTDQWCVKQVRDVAVTVDVK
jgi:hypothetical protein